MSRIRIRACAAGCASTRYSQRWGTSNMSSTFARRGERLRAFGRSRTGTSHRPLQPGDLGLLEEWNSAAESFGAAAQADATRADALLGQGIALLHAQKPAEALDPLERYLRLF